MKEQHGCVILFLGPFTRDLILSHKSYLYQGICTIASHFLWCTFLYSLNLEIISAQARVGRSRENYQFCISLKLKCFQIGLHSHIMHVIINNIAKPGVNLIFLIFFFGFSHCHLYLNF